MPAALVRWSAMAGLAILVGLFVPLSWVLHQLAGGSLSVAEWSQAKLVKLWRAK